MPIEIFRAGTHTAISGQAVTISAADLAATAAAYRTDLHEAPIVVGHPTLNAPAYGWIERLEAVGDRLLAHPHQVAAAFGEAVKQGTYKKVSAMFYAPTASANPVPGTWYLRHVGFLGAMPPAVKGLAAVAFAEESADDQQAMIASDAPLSTELHAPEAPAAAATDGDPAHTLSTDPTPPLTTEETDPMPQPTTTTALSAEEVLATVRAKLAAAEAERDTALRSLADKEAARRHGANVAFAEGLVQQARIPGTFAPVLVATLDALESAQGDTLAFGEGDAAKPLHTAIKDHLATLPEIIAFGERLPESMGQRQSAASRMSDSDLDSAARLLAAREGISYTAALKRV